ncbi:hypothetical protein AGMMS50262_05390 [Bacteroidia bacterium]|nr:hypothetical protein AGMMS50262_05390 [Bacteroidia bacterium]
MIYPEAAPVSHAPALRNSENTPQLHWTVDVHRYSNNMTLTYIVLDDDVEWQGDRLEIGTFSGNECRGSVLLQHYPQIEGHPFTAIHRIHYR